MPKVYDILEIILNKKYMQIKLIEIYPKSNILNFELIFNDQVFKEILESLDAITYSSNNKSSQFKKIGQRIYQLFFIDENGKTLKGLDQIFQKESDLILFIDDKIVNIPFELAYNGKKILGLKRCIYRTISTSHSNNPNIKKKKKKKSLLIIADPLFNSKHSYQEGQDLFEYLSKNHSNFFERIDFYSKEFGVLEAIDFLEEYDWIHYAGHGEFEKHWGGALLISHNKFLKAEDIQSFNNPPDFIFLNSCLSGQFNLKTKSSLTQKLLSLGVKNIIASSWLIRDENYSNFVLNFYKMLCNQFSIGESFLESKRSNYLEKDHKWFYYNLYGQPNS